MVKTVNSRNSQWSKQSIVETVNGQNSQWSKQSMVIFNLVLNRFHLIALCMLCRKQLYDYIIEAIVYNTGKKERHI